MEETRMTGSMGYYIKKGFKVLLLSMVFVLLSKILWHLSEVYFAKEDLAVLWVESDGKTETVRMYQYPELMVHNQRVNISGRSSPSAKVGLSVNERKMERTDSQSDGKFVFRNVQLHRGVNKIQVQRSATRFSFPQQYEVVFQGKKPQTPVIEWYVYRSELQSIDMRGFGEPGYTYCLKFAGHVDSVRCDGWGIFETSLFRVAQDTVAMFLSNAGIDTLVTIPIHSHGGQYSIGFPLALSGTTELFVDSNLSHVTVKLTIRRFPVASALYENLATGNISALDFASATFGRIDIQTNPLRNFQSRELPPKILASAKYADITLQANWDVSEGAKLLAISFDPPYGFSTLDSLMLQIPEGSLYSLTVTPDSVAGDRTIWKGPKANSEIFECSFARTTADQEFLREESAKKDQPPKTVIDLFRQLETNVFYKASDLGPMFREALGPIFSAIPLIWWLWLIYRHKERLGRYQKAFLGTFALLTFFHFFFPVLSVFTNVAGLVRYAEFLNNEWSRLLAEWFGLSYEDIGKFSIAGILLFNPLAIALVAPNEPVPAKSSIKLQLVLGLGLFASSMLFGFMFAESFHERVNQLKPFDISYFAFLCIAVIVVCMILYLLVSALRTIVSTTLRIALPRSKIYGALLVMILLPVLFDALTSVNVQLPLKPSLLWAVTSCCFGVILLYRGMNVAYRLSLKPVPVRKTWINALLVCGFAVIAFPKSTLFDAVSTSVDYRFLLIFFEGAVDLFPFLVLFAVVAMLHEDSAVRGYKLDRASKDFGLLLMSFFVVERGFWSGYRWMYIPISLILAYFLSRQYLFMDPETASERLKKNDSPLQDRKSSIQKVISYFVFKREFKDLKKLLDKKFAENQIEHADWEKKTADNESVRSNLRNQAKHDNVPLESVIFSHGIEVSPWENALLAMKVGAWLAIFWIFVFIRDFRDYPIDSDGVYQLFNLADLFLYRTLVWFIIAFVFGYYYHTLRGNTGIEKAAWFSLIVIAACIGPGILFTDTAKEIQELLIWGIQVFAYCMFVGFFAFDHRILRKNGFGWQEVGVIYNLAALSTFGSGLLAALLGILSGQLQALFTSMLKDILPK